MTDDQEQDDVVGEPGAAADHGVAADAAAIKFDHGVGRTLGAQAAMNAMTAGSGVSDALGAHVARIGSELVGRHPAFGVEAATAASRTFDFTTLVGTKLAGMESVSEQVSAAAKSWMTSASGAHGALTAAATAAAAFKFDDGMFRTPGVQAAMDAIAGPLSKSGADLIGRYPGLDAIKGYEFAKLAGMSADLESVSERVSAAAKSWMTAASGAHGALTAAAAFKFDGIAPMPGVQAAMNALAGPGLSDALGNARSGADLIGRYPGLDAIKGFDFAKLAGMDPNGVSSGLAAALKIHEGVGQLSGVQAAMNALASPGVKGLLGRDDLAQFGMGWANGELGRHLHGLTGLMGAGGAMADHLSIFDKVMGDSQRAMHEAMGRWTSSLTGPAAWMTEAMRGWSTLADGGHWAARLALRMALAAKRAVLRGDIDVVKRFLCDWLGFTAELVTPDLVGSASLVLLDEPAWLPDELLALDYDPRPTLRKLTLAEHRNCTRMITDPRRRANHQPVISLNKPIAKADSGSSTSLLELVAAKPQPELVAANDDISDPRVLRVLAKLTDRERRIAEEQGHVGTTWAEAAVACGGTSDEGEKVRRKVKRLSKSAAGPATAPCRQWPDAGQRESVVSQAAGT